MRQFLSARIPKYVRPHSTIWRGVHEMSARKKILQETLNDVEADHLTKWRVGKD